MDPEIEEEISKQIDLFLDEFMNEEYKGKDHIIAREHYTKVFYNLLPKYMKLSALVVCKTRGSEVEEILR